MKPRGRRSCTKKKNQGRGKKQLEILQASSFEYKSLPLKSSPTQGEEALELMISNIPKAEMPTRNITFVNANL
jgi:hypothetical protein